MKNNTLVIEAWAEAVVDSILEGDITRERLSKVYNKLYNKADKIVKRKNPCGIHKNEQGDHVCLACKEHPDFDEDSQFADNYTAKYGIKPNTMCCGGCPSHEQGKGCTATMPLACKAWTCPTVQSANPDIARKLFRIEKRAEKARLSTFRGDKKETLDDAEQRWKISR